MMSSKVHLHKFQPLFSLIITHRRRTPIQAMTKYGFTIKETYLKLQTIRSNENGEFDNERLGHIPINIKVVKNHYALV